MHMSLQSRTAFPAGVFVLTLAAVAALFGISASSALRHMSGTTPSFPGLPPDRVAIALPRLITEDGCADTDGGMNVYQQGTVTSYANGTKKVYTDSCTAGSTYNLTEYSCSGLSVQQQQYTCSAACGAGACKKIGTVYVADTIDTEPSPTTPGAFSDTLDVSDYKPGAFVDKILTSSFRNQYTDSFGGHPKISWFLLTTEGMCTSTQNDCTLIHSMMAPYAHRLLQYGDNVGWHYHPANWNVDANGNGTWDQQTTFDGTPLYNGLTDRTEAEKLLSSVVLNKHTYPSTFRAGWAWENTDYSNWLDDVVPYDFSNIAPLTSNPSCGGPDCETSFTVPEGRGNIFDWSRAVSDWSAYHPNAKDYQSSGTLKRWEFHSFMSWETFAAAFKRAAAGKDTLITIFTHNYNELDLQQMYLQMVVDTARNFPTVPFKFVNGLDGAKQVTDHSLDSTAPVLTLTSNYSSETDVTGVGVGTDVSTQPWYSGIDPASTVTVTSNEPLFTFPYFAVRANGTYLRLRPVSTAPTVTNGTYAWTYVVTPYRTADSHNAYGVGAVDVAGNTTATPAVGF